MSSLWRIVLTFGIPAALVANAIYGPLAPGFMRGFFDDLVVPFAIAYWFGLVFSGLYLNVQESLTSQGAGRGTVAIVIGVMTFIFLMAIGGPAALWQDPWMFGIAVMPGIDIVWPALHDWYLHRQETMASSSDTDTAPPDQPV